MKRAILLAVLAMLGMMGFFPLNGIMVVCTIGALATLLYHREIIRLSQAFLHPTAQGESLPSRIIRERMEATEKKLDATERALKQFSAAVSQYAQHLSSHTSAIQGLDRASHELKDSAVIQNRFLMSLIRGTEESHARRQDMLTTAKTASARMAKIAGAQHTPSKALPSYRALHPPQAVRPTTEVSAADHEAKTPFEVANLVEAMVLPYYRALFRLEREGLLTAEKTAPAAEATGVTAPRYRTLHLQKVEPTAPPPQDPQPSPAPSPLARPESPRTSPMYTPRHRHPLMPW